MVEGWRKEVRKPFLERKSVLLFGRSLDGLRPWLSHATLVPTAGGLLIVPNSNLSNTSFLQLVAKELSPEPWQLPEPFVRTSYPSSQL